MRLDLKVVMSQVLSKILSKVLLQVLVHVLVCSQTLAQAAPQDSIVGLWVTHDDDTQEPRAHIKIHQDSPLQWRLIWAHCENIGPQRFSR